MIESQTWSRWLREWAILALGLLVATHVVNGITYEKNGVLILVVILLSLLNSLIRPVLMTFFLAVSLPLIIATLGVGILFVLWLVNAILLYLTGALVPGFDVATFGDAMWGALWVSMVSLALNFLLGRQSFRLQSAPPRRPAARRKNHSDDDNIIDV